MYRVARLPIKDRSALFTETAARAGLTNAVIAEKDFWVCWTLGRLYAISGIPRLLFKGGTSLSKCFRLIERFSEDIDLGIERDDIGLGGDGAPSPEKGSSSQKKARRKLRDGTHEYVANKFLPTIQADFQGALNEPFNLALDLGGAESVVIFQYPRALSASAYGVDSYVESIVRLEMGARSDHHPTNEVDIEPYAASFAPSWFEQRTCKVVAQAPERTLLEKALILHTDIAKGKVTPRSSRHAYDLALMHRAGTLERVTLDLFKEVALHKLVFGADKHASEAPERGIRLVPDEDRLGDLELDYRRMNEMFFGTPPSFVEIVEELRGLEAAINSLEGHSQSSNASPL